MCSNLNSYSSGNVELDASIWKDLNQTHLFFVFCFLKMSIGLIAFSLNIYLSQVSCYLICDLWNLFFF